MNTDKIIDKELSDRIIKCAFNVHNILGYGFLEKVYENSLVIELVENGIEVKSQYPISVYYKSKLVREYKADLYIEDRIIIELKAEKEYGINLLRILNEAY